MKSTTMTATPKLVSENQGSPFSPQRIASVDAYRGLVMLLMMAEVLSFEHVSQSLPGSSFWAFLGFHQSHVPWVGCSLHDLIQPSFSFLVGVALPFSIASRRAKGLPFKSMLGAAIKRALILIALGIFLRSQHSSQTYFTFEDTLSQIGLGYVFLFLLGFCKQRVQVIALVVILVGYWFAFAMFPVSAETVNPAVTGVPADWQYNMTGFAEHWNKNTNLAWQFDRWFLNLFPREHPFLYNGGGYSTLSFIPTLGTMILGLLTGNILKSDKSDSRQKVKKFVIAGAALIGASLIIHSLGINPIVKRIWTPNWVLFSGGCCFLLLAIFYWLVDMHNKRKWVYFLIVIGMNSIAAYVIADGLGSYIVKSVYIHLGQNYDQIFGDPYSTLVKGAVVLTIEWLILYWMYKKKVFIKI